MIGAFNIWASVGVVGAVVLFFVGKWLWGKRRVPYVPEKKPDEKAKGAEPGAEICKTGGYKAYVWEPNPGIVACHINKPVGLLWNAEPTLPMSGQVYFCKRDKDGKLIPYDPRLEKVNPEESPERLYRAINAQDVVDPVYTSESTWWEKVNVIAPYIISVLIVIAIFIKLGG